MGKENKKRTEKAFTLVELLAVLVVLAMLLALAVTSVTEYLKRGTTAYYKGLETDVLAAGRDYLLDYKSLYPREVGNATVVTLQELLDNKYIDTPKDERGDACDANITVIKTGKNKYDYHLCLNCGKYYQSEEEECSYVGNNNELRNYTINLNASLPSQVRQGDEITVPTATVEEQVGTESKVITDNLEGKPKTIDTTILGTTTVTWTYRTQKVSKTVQVVDKVAPVIESATLKYESGNSYSGEITNKKIALNINMKDYACEVGTSCREKYPNLEGSGIKTVYYKEKNETTWRVYNTNRNKVTIPVTESLWGEIEIKVVDNAGNESETITKTFMSDRTNPSKTIVTYISGESSTKWQNNIKIKLSATDDIAVSHYEIYIDGVYYGTTGENFTPPNNFSSNNVTFRAVDLAGNKGEASDIQKIHMDTENPSKVLVNLNGYQSGSWTNKNVKQTYSATDNVEVAYYEYATTPGEVGEKTNNPWTISTDGEYTYYARAIDLAGNIGPWSDAYTIRRDTVKPECSLMIANNPKTYGGWYIENVQIGFNSTSDDFSGIKQTNIDRPVISTSTSTNGDIVTGTIVDNASNTNTCTISVKADITTPTPKAKKDPLTLGKEDYNFKDNINPNFGPAGGTVVCDPPTSLKTGSYTVTCTASGNNGKTGSVSFKVQHSYAASERTVTYSCSKTCSLASGGNCQSSGNYIIRYYMCTSSDGGQNGECNTYAVRGPDGSITTGMGSSYTSSATCSRREKYCPIEGSVLASDGVTCNYQ